MKLLCEDLIPTDGLIRKHSHLRIARFHQARNTLPYLTGFIFRCSTWPTSSTTT